MARLRTSVTPVMLPPPTVRDKENARKLAIASKGRALFAPGRKGQRNRTANQVAGQRVGGGRVRGGTFAPGTTAAAGKFQ